MIDENIDLLQVKIEKAREKLPKETREAISSVNWRGVILSMKDKKGYNLEQLSALELETELLLCGLVNPLNYQQELEMRMGIHKSQSEILVNELNELIFKKIKDSLISISSKKKNISSIEIETVVPKRDFTINNIKQEEKEVLTNAGIEVVVDKKESNVKKEEPLENREDMLVKVENPVPTTIPKTTNSISAQKLAEPFKMTKTQTEYSLNNITKQNTDELSQKTETKKVDPYRLDPNE